MSDNERSLNEIRNAEVVEGQGGPNEWLLRFGENDYDFVNKTERNRLAVENSDLLDDAERGVFLGINRPDNPDNAIRFKADFEAEQYVIGTNGDRVTVPSRYHDRALGALVDGDGDAMFDLYRQIRAENVREDAVNSFLPRFFEDAIEVTDDGWVVEDTFLVQWNAENYLTTDQPIHVRDGDTTVPVDDSKQARDLNFNLPESITTETPDGEKVTLGERELRFLGTVEVLLNPWDYVDMEVAQDIDQMKEWNRDPVRAAAQTASVTAFTDEKTGLHHGHSITKHRLGDLGVTDDALDRLYYNDFDHAGVVELAYREDEFRGAPFDVFEGTHNNDDAMWEKIQTTKENAPIPERVRAELRQMYTDEGATVSGLSL